LFWINFFNIFRLFWFINIKKIKKKKNIISKAGKQEGKTPYAASKKFSYVFYMFLFFMETKLFSNVFPLFINKNLCFCAHREQPSSAGSATVNPDWYGFNSSSIKEDLFSICLNGGVAWFACPSHSSVFLPIWRS
jgi:quinol-cytochrome oxidoreductase complex cytochrome b subunit